MRSVYRGLPLIVLIFFVGTIALFLSSCGKEDKDKAKAEKETLVREMAGVYTSEVVRRIDGQSGKEYVPVDLVIPREENGGKHRLLFSSECGALLEIEQIAPEKVFLSFLEVGEANRPQKDFIGGAKTLPGEAKFSGYIAEYDRQAKVFRISLKLEGKTTTENGGRKDLTVALEYTAKRVE